MRTDWIIPLNERAIESRRAEVADDIFIKEKELVSMRRGYYIGFLVMAAGFSLLWLKGDLFSPAFIGAVVGILIIAGAMQRLKGDMGDLEDEIEKLYLKFFRLSLSSDSEKLGLIEGYAKKSEELSALLKTKDDRPLLNGEVENIINAFKGENDEA